MCKILNDRTAPGLRGSFVRREIDQTNYHLRNTATDLTIPKPKREFLKRNLKYIGAMLWNQLQGRRKHQKIGGAPASRDIEKGTYKIILGNVGDGGGGEKEKFPRHTIPKLQVFDHIFLKNMEISKQKGHL